ncbi:MULTISPECIES: hypothetical protein [Aeromonas]|uniref:hypothetical protein n=1 Tax=Aeromonas TaxID=642 RepID=UPI000B03AFDC|nr:MULTISPECIES: hypothetical protein [Aeromonas]
MDLNTLKRCLVELEPDDFVNEHIVNAASLHVTEEQIEFIRIRISEAVGIDIASSEIVIVGSAKLGFGLFNKKKRDQAHLPAFRPFGPESDIDVAVCSPQLFDTVWNELSDYALAKPWMPHKMNKTGDYLVYGWLRPDQVPFEARLRTLDSFKDRLMQLSRTPQLMRRKISGAIYRDLTFLKKYQVRGISHCRKELIIP